MWSIFSAILWVVHFLLGSGGDVRYAAPTQRVAVTTVAPALHMTEIIAPIQVLPSLADADTSDLRHNPTCEMCDIISDCDQCNKKYAESPRMDKGDAATTAVAEAASPSPSPVKMELLPNIASLKATQDRRQRGPNRLPVASNRKGNPANSQADESFTKYEPETETEHSDI